MWERGSGLLLVWMPPASLLTLGLPLFQRHQEALDYVSKQVARRRKEQRGKQQSNRHAQLAKRLKGLQRVAESARPRATYKDHE
jgi:hypothetical protein